MGERGRPRAFDRDRALRCAMELFWARGYEGASIGELAKTMGINRPSLYAAFGSKEELFREALELYDEVEGTPIQRALDDGATARDAVEAALRHNACAYVRRDRPRGCLVVVASLAGVKDNAAVRALLAKHRRLGERALRLRIERGIADGDVPSGVDARRIAAFYTAMLQGLAVHARDGSARSELQAIVDAAMSAWDNLTQPPAASPGAGKAVRRGRPPATARRP